MKSKGILILPLIFALFACQHNPAQEASSTLNIADGAIDAFTMKDKANYYWNLTKSEFEEDGIPSKTYNLVYDSQEIVTPC